MSDETTGCDRCRGYNIVKDLNSGFDIAALANRIWAETQDTTAFKKQFIETLAKAGWSVEAPTEPFTVNGDVRIRGWSFFPTPSEPSSSSA
jgi:hypothetical protein